MHRICATVMVFAILCLICTATKQGSPADLEKSRSQIRCSAFRTCKECITASPQCAWCSEEGFANFYPRCDDMQTLKKRNCSGRHRISPKTSISRPKDYPLSSMKTDEKSAIQLKPQKIVLELRPHQEIKFNISFRQAQNYPVDLYYLMDLTRSMDDDKEKLGDLGQRLVDTMHSITTNFRLGFGSFVDKVMMPYVDMHPTKLLNPCPDNQTCEAPYGFKNHLSLSNDTHLFTDKVKSAKTSANLDDAEGGFDALMQVVVCKNEIHWDQRSRKIVVFATDSGFHYAGDGKLGGIVKPNDEKCHMDKSGLYTQSIIQDYPSLSQINRIVREQKINLIFAVPKEVLPVYEKLSAVIEAAKTSQIETDSSNIVDLIKQQYDKIRSEVILTSDIPDGISITYYSACRGNKVKETNKCADLRVGDTVTFEAKLTLEKCPKNRANWSHTIHIHPLGLNEVLEIDLKMFCECDCENPSVQIHKSPKCSRLGTHECGICRCPVGRYGRQCECNNNKAENDDNWGNCRAKNSSIPCTGRGDCVCGGCECHQPEKPGHRVYGLQCECDNFSCDRGENEEPCGGKGRGECDCGKCICEKDWKGNTCDCSTRIDTCTPPVGEVCSGNGKCVCGRCQCNQTQDGAYGGVFCEDCPTCKGKCGEFRPCVECQAFGQGLSQEECKNCSFKVELVENLSEVAPSERRCIFIDDKGCSFVFTYTFDKNRNATVLVQGTKECPKVIDALAIGAGITGGVLVVGLVILLVFRVLVYCKDSRNYAKFLEERNNKSVWKNDNPIFQPAKINYTNPIYGQVN